MICCANFVSSSVAIRKATNWSLNRQTTVFCRFDNQLIDARFMKINAPVCGQSHFISPSTKNLSRASRPLAFGAFAETLRQISSSVFRSIKRQSNYNTTAFVCSKLLPCLPPKSSIGSSHWNMHYSVCNQDVQVNTIRTLSLDTTNEVGHWSRCFNCVTPTTILALRLKIIGY